MATAPDMGKTTSKMQVLGGGCSTPGMTCATRFPEAAYQLGRSLLRKAV